MCAKDAEADSSTDNECPTCGKVLKSWLGVQQHHSKTHDDPLHVTVKCAWCGNERETYPSHAEQHERHFCAGDKECESKWRLENSPAGEDSPTWTGGKVVVECAWCGKERKAHPSKVSQSKNHFCGGDSGCQGKWIAKNMAGSDSPIWVDPVAVECTWCGSELERAAHEAVARGNHFCGGDSRCEAKWRSENVAGSDHPCWRGGPPSYGEGWDTDKRESVRENQNHECAGCGVHESDLPRKLDVHHIQKARTFDDPEARNAKSNLVALCHSCHLRWEQMSPLRPVVGNTAAD